MEWFNKPAEEQLHDIRASLRTISMLMSLYELGPDKAAVLPFKSQEEMAGFFKMMINHLLPEKDRY